MGWQSVPTWSTPRDKSRGDPGRRNDKICNGLESEYMRTSRRRSSNNYEDTRRRDPGPDEIEDFGGWGCGERKPS